MTGPTWRRIPEALKILVVWEKMQLDLIDQDVFLGPTYRILIDLLGEIPGLSSRKGISRSMITVMLQEMEKEELVVVHDLPERQIKMFELLIPEEEKERLFEDVDYEEFTRRFIGNHT